MSEFEDVMRRARDGRVVIGINRATARRVLTDVSLAMFREKTGEAPYLQKAVVWSAFVGGPALLIVSVLLSMRIAGWWSLLLIPPAILIWVGYCSASSRRGAGMMAAHLVVLIAVAGAVLSDPGQRELAALGLSYAAALWLGRFVHCGATAFVRALVIRNPRAFDWLRDNLEFSEISSPVSENRGRRPVVEVRPSRIGR